MEKQNREETIERIISAIQQKMTEKRMKQKEVLELCRKKGYEISQSELSRILSHKITLSLYSALALCDALDLDFNRIFYPDRIRNDRLQLSAETFITDPQRTEMQNYLGRYHVLFHGTNSREEKFLKGEIVLIEQKEEGHAYCAVFFKLYTNDMDRWGKPIIKRYRGRFLVSPQLGIAYCFLVNNKLGEICTIEFRHRTFFYKSVECRLGLVLTTTTGEKKVPAAHKIAIYRDALSEEQEAQIGHMLKLDNNEILIEADTLEKLAQGSEAGEQNFFEQLSRAAPGVLYCMVSAAVLKSVNRKLSNAQISSLFSLLRQYSEEEYTIHLDELEDEMIFDILQRNTQG